MTSVNQTGRFCNQVIKNLGVSIIAERHNLYVDYYNKKGVETLGIKLFLIHSSIS